MRTELLTDRELGDFCRNLSVLLHAGISTADSLYLLAQEESGWKQQSFTDLGMRLDQGCVLSEALLASESFPGQVCGMIRIGERTGRMEETLTYLAELYEDRHRIRKFLRSALAYPSLILLLVLIVVAVLLVEVLPVFDSVYASLGSRMTGPAAALLKLGQLLKGGLPVIGVLLAMAAVAVLLTGYVPAVKSRAAAFFQKHIADRGVFRKFNNARFARALAMGFASGLSVEEAVKLAAELLSDVTDAAKRCDMSVRLLEAGKPLPEAMEAAGLLDPSESRMLAVGIRGGNADQVMRQIADRKETAAEETMERTVSSVEPAMVVLTSLLVGVILLAVMLPLMNIMSAIG